MARPYLNSICFPGESLEDSMSHLTALRVGMAELLRTQTISTPVMCSIRAAGLPLSSDYKVLADGMHLDGGRHRDTVQFFLTLLDQRTPAQSALTPDQQAAMDPHLVEAGLVSAFDPDAGSVLVACALDRGVLLSIRTHGRWQSDKAEFELMVGDGEVRTVWVDNVCNIDTAKVVAARAQEDRSKLSFENWNTITQGAARAPQLDEWFNECRRRPGLEQVIMRSLFQVHAQGFHIDGHLVKKLEAGGDTALYEVRAWFNGSNNLRILFGRDSQGRALYSYGGLKSHPDWYDTAIPQALRFLSEQG